MSKAKRSERRDVLLRAAYEMLQKCIHARYVVSPAEVTVFYDDAECDGHCLLDDIRSEIENPNENQPEEKP